MAGGIIQIVTYGTQDLYLTGNPEITYFKVVYRRHTNFSVESYRVDFDDAPYFGTESAAKLPKNGDLINKASLNIILPEIDFRKGEDAGQYDDVTIQDDAARIAEINTDPGELSLALADTYTVDDFTRLNADAYRRALEIYQSDNGVDTVQEMKDVIEDAFPDDENTDNIVASFNTLVSGVSTLPPFEGTSLLEVSSNYTGDDKEVLMSYLNAGIASNKTIISYYDAIVQQKRDDLADAESSNIKFAWVDRIGHAIIDSVEIEIGGQVIDKQYGNWINIWYELTKKKGKEDAYRKMIGDVKELTTFDRTVKPKYLMRIPLQFWFCRHNGLALPLLALEYHDVVIRTKFRRLEHCCYVEKDRFISIPGESDDYFLDEIGDGKLINFEAYLDIDYIYLDSQERKRFAQVSHEYLIEEIQMVDFEEVTVQNFSSTVDFFHPSKEFVWIIQKDSYRQNTDGYNQCRWDNYTASTDKQGNAMTFGSIEFHGYERVMMIEGSYYNYLIPMKCHSATPDDGINVYSFSLMPEEYQPSGTANTSRISSIRFNIVIDPLMFLDNDTAHIEIYSRNYNILRIASGMGTTAYSVK